MSLDAMNPKLRARVSAAIVQESEARRAVHHPSPNAPGVWVDPAENAGALEATARPWIELVLPYPPSTNTCWRNVVIAGRSRRVNTRELLAYKKQVSAILLQQNVTPISGGVGMRLSVFRPKRIGDLSNRLKALEDCLSGVCYRDDSQVEYIEMKRFEDKANPRVEVVIWQLHE